MEKRYSEALDFEQRQEASLLLEVMIGSDDLEPFAQHIVGMEAKIDALEAENTELRERIKELEEALEAYGNHSSKCLLSQYREGRPTEGRGYETLYGYGDKAKWYRDGERPECTCGFDAALAGGKE